MPEEISVLKFAKWTADFWKDIVRELANTTNKLARRGVEKLSDKEVGSEFGKVVSLYVWKGVSAWALADVMEKGEGGGEDVLGSIVQMLNMPEIEEWADMEKSAMVHLTRCWILASKKP